MSDRPWDVIVVGSGPAGLAAAAEVAQAGFRCLCLDRLGPGGALMNLGALHETDEEIDGPTLVARLADEAMEHGVELGFAEVEKVSGAGPYVVAASDGETRTARAVVIATGMNKGRLGVEGEDAFEGRGISHCAACDGPLYAGKPVVVAGAGGWADHEALELRDAAGSVTVVAENGGDGAVAGRIVGLSGDDGLSAVIVRGPDGERTIPADAVFVYVGETPASACAPASMPRDGAGRLAVDFEGRGSGMAFAVGDVRSGSPRTAARAIDDGRRAGRALAAALANVGA